MSYWEDTTREGRATNREKRTSKHAPMHTSKAAAAQLSARTDTRRDMSSRHVSREPAVHYNQYPQPSERSGTKPVPRHSGQCSLDPSICYKSAGFLFGMDLRQPFVSQQSPQRLMERFEDLASEAGVSLSRSATYPKAVSSMTLVVPIKQSGAGARRAFSDKIHVRPARQGAYVSVGDVLLAISEYTYRKHFSSRDTYQIYKIDFFKEGPVLAGINLTLDGDYEMRFRKGDRSVSHYYYRHA
ncbi:hypothetical protein BOTBODRAFT_169658 [Botryobasidium botryosum FD-172 SS1]|uniref:Uncharacterized protein n=1 Tax=Botryobasidium botryosum (strain FD-172 SS1) TaxID=930990 RepID=A0A067NB30_BOTB1|nr:hypothetical protein BOTBODRAFT_169658 [Botryobasidium botryosum FD-172 SS1]